MIATRRTEAFSPFERIQTQTGPCSLENVPGEILMTNGNGTPLEAAPPPQLNVLAQYTKDLSFENPNAPASLGPQAQQPAINIQINVNANNVAENEFEVALLIEGKAQNGDKGLFTFDLTYAAR